MLLIGKHVVKQIFYSKQAFSHVAYMDRDYVAHACITWLRSETIENGGPVK